MSNCLFCGIAAGRRPASVVYRDQACLAIMDIRPISPGHLLVFPVSHAAGLSELDPADGAALFEIGRRIAT